MAGVININPRGVDTTMNYIQVYSGDQGFGPGDRNAINEWLQEIGQVNHLNQNRVMSRKLHEAGLKDPARK